MGRIRVSRRLAKQRSAGTGGSRGLVSRAARTSGVGRAVACGVAAVTVLVLAYLPSVAGAAVYRLTYAGVQSETFTTTGQLNGVEPGAFLDCNYVEHGATTVHWRDVWSVTANVFPKTGQVTITGMKSLAGPADSQEPGDSKISGQAANGTSQGCARAHKAGKYDCTAKAIVPHHQTLGFEPTNQDFHVLADGYLVVDAHYAAATSTEPSGLPCGALVGSNSAPGGLQSSDFSYTDYSAADVKLSKERLANMKIGASLPLEGLGQNHGAGWGDPQNFPAAGRVCTGLSDTNSGELCTYATGAAAPKRSGTLTIERVK
jgi:hypothetical protein